MFQPIHSKQLTRYACWIRKVRDIKKSDFELKKHDAHKIMFVTKGTIHVECDGKHYDVSEGQVFIVNPFEENLVSTPYPGSEHYFFFINYEFFKYLGVDLAFTMYYNYITDEGLKDKLNCFLDKLLAEKEPDNFDINIEFIEIVKYIDGNFKSGKDSVIPKYLIRVFHYINNNFTQKLTIESVARHYGVSRSTLIKDIKKYTDTTFSDYVTYLRLIKALRMEREGDYTMMEISHLCGFYDYSHYSKMRAFRKETPYALRSVRVIYPRLNPDEID